MTFIALGLGLIGGFLMAAKFIDHIIMLLYYARYRHESAYRELYGSMDSELYFELMKGHAGAPKSYDKYLLLNQNKGTVSFKIFRETYSDIATILIKVYGVGLLFSAIFYHYWIFLLMPFVFAHVVFALHRRLIKHYDRHFYLMMMHTSILLAD